MNLIIQAVLVLVVVFLVVPLAIKIWAFSMSIGFLEGLNHYRRKKDAKKEE